MNERELITITAAMFFCTRYADSPDEAFELAIAHVRYVEHCLSVRNPQPVETKE